MFVFTHTPVFQVLRYGGAWGIELGRRGTPEIMSLWDESSCLVTNSQSSVSKCTDQGRVMNEARKHGLATLLQTIHTSTAQVGVRCHPFLCHTLVNC